LMDSGLFGSNEYYQDILRQRKQRLGRKLMSRELGVDQSQLRRDNQLISQVNP
jgi:NADH/NAD ratio-sensing transcriptional regulator Rex